MQNGREEISPEGRKPDGASPVVETFALTRRFGDFTAADNITLTINAGEIFGLIGPNGAGKSTLIKMLTTMLPPTSGRASVAGFDLAKEPAQVRRHIGYVPQLLSVDNEVIFIAQNLTGELKKMCSTHNLFAAARFASRDGMSLISHPEADTGEGAM